MVAGITDEDNATIVKKTTDSLTDPLLQLGCLDFCVHRIESMIPVGLDKQGALDSGRPEEFGKCLLLD